MISPTQSTAQPAAQPNSGTTSKTSALTSDFETFLLMLTAQARNQDPLEPLDSSQYASQLAQFSMVEQQVQTNTLLSSLASNLGGTNIAELANWVGMDVRTASAFRMEGDPVTLFINPDSKADKAVLTIKNSDGTVVDQINVAVPDDEHIWAGTDSSGAALPTGNYTATLESYKGGEKLAEELASAYNRVIEAQISNGAVMLTLKGGSEVSPKDVSAVRTGA